MINCVRWEPLIAAALLAGCTGASSQVQETPSHHEQAVQVIRDRENDLASVRSEIAVARIAMAKQDAEVQELRATVQRLRQENSEAQQALMAYRRDAEEKREAANIIQTEQDKDGQTKHAQQLAALDGTVTSLRERLELLTHELARTTVTDEVKTKQSRSLQPKDSDTRKSSEKARLVPSVMREAGSSTEVGRGMVQTISSEEPSQPRQVTVMAGDTLWRIAQRHKTTVEQLRQTNKLERDAVSAGMVLTIPPSH
jgi:LysM repeat protein